MNNTLKDTISTILPSLITIQNHDETREGIFSQPFYIFCKFFYEREKLVTKNQ